MIEILKYHNALKARLKREFAERPNLLSDIINSLECAYLDITNNVSGLIIQIKTPEDLFNQICGANNCNPDAVKDRLASRELILIRKYFFYQANLLFGKKYGYKELSTIASLPNASIYDHSTVLYHIRFVSEKIEKQHPVFISIDRNWKNYISLPIENK